jgi:hypothetical protein
MTACSSVRPSHRSPTLTFVILSACSDHDPDVPSMFVTPPAVDPSIEASTGGFDLDAATNGGGIPIQGCRPRSCEEQKFDAVPVIDPNGQFTALWAARDMSAKVEVSGVTP